MTKENAQELALRMQERGYIVNPPDIVDDVLAAHLIRKKRKTPRPRHSGISKQKKVA